MTARKVNLNADMGESYGAYKMGDDAAMLELVTSANVACGFHGGDPLVMRRTVAEAKRRGVSIGSHPSYPDLQGFGRRKMHVAPAELEAMIIYQTGALAALAEAEGTKVTHIKPHGALNNMAAVDLDLSLCIARAVKAVDPDMILLATAGSQLLAAGEQLGLPTAGEIFADRTYTEEGNLTPRSETHALIHDPEQSATQILRFLDADGIVTPSGKKIDTPIHSICVHGDGAEAVAIARHVKQRLTDAGYALAPLPEMF